MTGTPEAEVSITEHLVRELLDQQHRDLSDLPLSLLGSGWDNVMYRLGNSMLVPQRNLSVALECCTYVRRRMC